MQEKFVDQEVRIRLLEELNQRVEKRLDKMDDKLSTQFYWVMGTMITLFSGILLLK